MSQVENDFAMMCRIGYGCGLTHLDEAYSQISSHYDVFFPVEEAHKRLGDLAVEVCVRHGADKTIRSVMGDAWCAERDAEEAAYWESKK